MQLSINAMKPFDYHLELGAKLAPLRESGVLVVGSGNVVHNLGGIDCVARRTPGSTGRSRFDDAAREPMTDAPAALPVDPGLARLRRRRADPRPLHPAALPGRARRAPPARGADVLVDGYAYGSLSMTAYTLDLPVEPVRRHG